MKGTNPQLALLMQNNKSSIIFFCQPSTKEVNYDDNASLRIQIPDKEDWHEISDVAMMEELYKIYDRVTPAIKEMIRGKELRVPDAVYRMKWEGGNNSTPAV